jgi:tetratricopeptide (TPR) repeat protein
MDIGKYTESENYLLRAVQSDAATVVEYHNLALLYNRYLNDPHNAKKYYEKALALNADIVDTNLDYGYLLLESFNDIIGARRHFEKAIKINQNNYKAHWFVALALEKADTDPIGVELRMQSAIELNPKMSILHTKLGIAKMGGDEEASWQAARHCFEKALELDPGDEIASYNLGSIYAFNLKDYDAAAKYYEKAILLDLKEIAVYQNLGNLYLYELNNTKRAKLLFEQAIQLFGPNAYAYFQLGTIYYGYENYAEAKAFLSKANELYALEDTGGEKHFLSVLYFNLALANRELEDYEAAKTYFQKAIENDPDLGKAYGELAALLSNNFKDYSSARFFAERGLQICPESVYGFYNYAVILQYLGENGLALSAIEKVQKIDPELVEGYWRMGMILESMLDYEGAVLAYTQAVKKNPQHIDSHRQLAELYLENLENYELALVHFKTLLRIAPTPEKYHLAIARTYYLLGAGTAETDRRKTLKYIDNAIKYGTKYYQACYSWIALNISKKEKYEDAIFYQKKAIENKGCNDDVLADWHESIAIWLYNSPAKTREAKEYLQKATAIAPHAYTFSNLGLTCERLGEFAEAKKNYETSIAMDPGNKETHNRLAALVTKHFPGKEYKKRRN